uniref:Swi3 domain-containing protein n=1 Tax=Strongyloides papillosus TaxID=174720 RepID=A0A0N5B1U2_STREA
MNRNQRKRRNETHNVRTLDMYSVAGYLSNRYKYRPSLFNDDNSSESTSSSGQGNRNNDHSESDEINEYRVEVQKDVIRFNSFPEEFFNLPIKLLEYLFPSEFRRKVNVEKWAYFLLDWLDYQITVIKNPSEDVIVDFINTINLDNLDSAFIQENIFGNKHINRSESGIVKLFFKLDGKIKSLYGNGETDSDNVQLSFENDLNSSEDDSSSSKLTDESPESEFSF